MIFRTLIACFLLYATACKSPVKLTNDELAIKQIVFDIISADNLSDIESVLSLYDTAATLMPPGKPIINGIAAVRKNYEQIFSNGKLKLQTEIATITVADNWANITGRNTGSALSLKDSSIKTIDSKYMMFLVRKKSTKWKIKTLIWNDN